jgi:hypothetical protein
MRMYEWLSGEKLWLSGGVVADKWNSMTKSWISLATWAVLWIDSSIFFGSGSDFTLNFGSGSSSRLFGNHVFF